MSLLIKNWSVWVGIISALLWGLRYFSFRVKENYYFDTKQGVNKLDSLLMVVIFLIGISSFSFIIYGLSGPKVILGKSLEQEKISDTYIVLDISRSMLANDFSPDRLTAAKKIIKNFLESKPVSRVSIVLFAEKVLTYVPLTDDFNYLIKATESINLLSELGDGTNIGDALALTVEKLRKTLSPRKSIILITDGVAQFESVDPLLIAEDAKRFKIKIYSVGIGTNKDAQIPTKSMDGNYYMTLIPGSSFDREILKGLSQKTEGKFFTAENSQKLSQVFDTISHDEEEYILKNRPHFYRDFSYEYLTMGAILFVVCLILELTLLRRSL